MRRTLPHRESGFVKSRSFQHFSKRPIAPQHPNLAGTNTLPKLRIAHLLDDLWTDFHTAFEIQVNVQMPWRVMLHIDQPDELARVRGGRPR